MGSQYTVALVGKVLDALNLRQITTAQNIANANSAHYVPKDVSFEASLARAAAEGPDAVRRFSAEVTARPFNTDQQELRLDLEMQTASATAQRYSALSDLLGREMEIQRLATRGQ
ncbi:flagellar basal body rod protein FlgB [Novosphingobium beihaiensis]|uniref:Flagellar basal body rod protein FlgB n=1 Tax=Novosphingobium beihaiensis TaxID=2930389 RepID=A0ABT0BPL3_9SPHN|nr:hypothetical protein [Novosphingobium beihaiensis]MCJ2186994.1 hypothetical protein [Novosphingobium beihaiensis]